jgi:NAD+ synthase
MACAINPLGDLYKTQVRDLARYLGVPEEILDKAPTAGLWPGQTDEEELGLTYDIIDQILFLLIDRRKSREETIAEGHEKAAVDNVIDLMKKSEFKRKLPPIAKVSDMTFGIDFLSPLDQKK